MRPQLSSAADRRAFVRYESSEPATVDIDGRSFACRLSDISLGGALLEGNLGICPGSRLTLRLLDLPALEVAVVHCSKNYFGVQFLELEIAKGLVEGWLRRRTEGL